MIFPAAYLPDGRVVFQIKMARAEKDPFPTVLKPLVPEVRPAFAVFGNDTRRITWWRSGQSTELAVAPLKLKDESKWP
jgi:hypothetical protein